MKKHFTIALLLFTLFFINTNTSHASDFAEDFGTFQNVELDKVWTIKMNKHENLLQAIDVWVEDENKVRVPVQIKQSGRNLKIINSENYLLNKTYTLYIASRDTYRLKKPQKIQFKTTASPFNNVAVNTRMKDIQAQYNLLKPKYTGNLYATVPSTKSPYSLGSLRKEALQDALNTTKLIRFIAHLPYDITLNDQFNKEAQAAAVVNAANNAITHYPTHPPKMEESLFTLGQEGASTSNLGMGYSSIVQSIVDGYMEDGDQSNIDRVGHRLWILSPKLQQVGFGFAANPTGTTHTAMKVIAPQMYSVPSADYDYVSWPAHTAMPTNYFTTPFPWSVSLNDEKYDIDYLENIKVQLVRLNDNKKWNFSLANSDGYFNISTGGYGYLPYTIIFRPKEGLEYKANDHFRVTISNLTTVDGQNTSLQFETKFFTLK